MKEKLDNKQAQNKKHHLFHGGLSDVPGRNETWDDYVRYRGNSRWELISEGTDFGGTNKRKDMKEHMTTHEMVMWVLERDSELSALEVRRPSRTYGSVQDDEKIEPAKVFGPFAKRLREIALEAGANYCVQCLDRWLTGAWPPEPVIRILNVLGVIERGVWVRIHHAVYDVITNCGPAYLYKPNDEKLAKVVLKSESSTSSGRLIKLTPKVISELDALRPKLEQLEASIRS